MAALASMFAFLLSKDGSSGKDGVQNMDKSTDGNDNKIWLSQWAKNAMVCADIGLIGAHLRQNVLLLAIAFCLSVA